MKILNLKSIVMILSLGLMLSSCEYVGEQMESENTLSSRSVSDQGMTMNEMTFTATAQIAHCHGENIRFTGIIENRVKTSANAGKDGVHYIRQFTVKGMTGTGLSSGTMYDVVGGAEMFSIKDAAFNPDGSLNLGNSITESDIVIHRGTLVFVSRTDGSRVVARHVITKVPGAGLKDNLWECGGNS